MSAQTKIPADFQIGLTWKNDEGRLCRTVAHNPHKNGKRIAWLVESSFVGTCAIGAMHYYARIKVSSQGWIEEGRENIICGGYGGKNRPQFATISLDAERILTRVERDASDEIIGKKGDSTYRFNTEAEARTAGIKLFGQCFGPGWVLLPELLEDGKDEYPILAET